MAFENRRLSGRFHWLVVPVKHIRDIESLTVADLPLRTFCTPISSLLPLPTYFCATERKEES